MGHRRLPPPSGRRVGFGTLGRSDTLLGCLTLLPMRERKLVIFPRSDWNIGTEAVMRGIVLFILCLCSGCSLFKEDELNYGTQYCLNEKTGKWVRLNTEPPITFVP